MSFKVMQETRMQDTDACAVPGDLVTDMAVEEFTAEDVEHIDDAIKECKHASNATSMEGLEWVRNKVAARAGVLMKDEGTISYPAPGDGE